MNNDNTSHRETVAVILFVVLMTASSTASAASCKVIVTATGGVVGTIAGIVIDIFSFGASLGGGTIAGGALGGTAGRATAEGICPDDEAEMIEEISLVELLKTCRRTTYLPRNPFWNKRDFCEIPGSRFMQGKDVSIMSGRQLDHVQVIGRLSALFYGIGADLMKKRKITKGQHAIFRDMGSNLRQCRWNYHSSGNDDWCGFTPSWRTARYFGAKAGREVTRTTYNVIASAKAAVEHLAGDFEASP